MIMNQALADLFLLSWSTLHRIPGSCWKKQLATGTLRYQFVSGAGSNTSICDQSSAVGVLRIVLANTSISQIAHQALRFSSFKDHRSASSSPWLDCDTKSRRWKFSS